MMRLLIFAVIAVLLLQACTTTGPGPGPASRDLAREARTLYQSGNYSKAAELWRQLAAQAPERGDVWLLQAADAYRLANQWEMAATVAQQVNRDRLDDSQSLLLDLILAEFAINQGDFDSAGVLLAYDPISIPQNLRRRLQALQSRLRALQENPDTQALTRFQRQTESQTLLRPADYVGFLRDLDQIPIQRLQLLSQQAFGNPNLRGWLDLAIALRKSLFINLEPAQLETPEDHLADWSSDHPGHALNNSRLQQLAAEYADSFRAPPRVAVLLPTQGRFMGTAHAIRDGLMAAYLNDPKASGTQLKFYSVGEDPSSVAAAYFQAQESGVDWIVGPLTRDGVQRLLSLSLLSTPVLALNRPSDLSVVNLELADQIFNFALLPESEALQAADRALQDGHRRAVILTPDSGWGQRMSAAFREGFEAGGGIILHDTRFRRDQTDHSSLMRNVLALDSSNERKQRLQSLLGVPLGFESQRRQDIDMIFLAAGDRQGRLIKPQLKFHDAGAIPVYSTSHLYSGVKAPRQDRDLNGINLPLPAPMLQPIAGHPGAAELASRNKGSRDAFYALGADAWNILPYLEVLTHNPGLGLQGELGKLAVDTGGNVQRHLPWARFRGGVPRALNP